MTQPGIKLTTYFSERDRVEGRLLADELFDLYDRHAMQVTFLVRGIGGFGQRNQLQTDRLLTLSENLPAVCTAIDTQERVERALPELLRVTTHGLITLERAQLARGHDLGGLQLAHDASHATKLTLYGGRSGLSGRHTGYLAAVDVLRRSGVAGASVLLAVDGTLNGKRRRARLFGRNPNLALMLTAVGDAASIRLALAALPDLLDDPVVTVESVQVCKANGRFVSEPRVEAAVDRTGLPIWQKLTIHTEEQAKVGGRPLHRELVRRLREAGAAGATLLRGVRGFYEDHEPFVDRMLQLRRNVPIHAVLVDTPERMRHWWPIVDELTHEAGLVTAEPVPATQLAQAPNHVDAPGDAGAGR